MSSGYTSASDSDSGDDVFQGTEGVVQVFDFDYKSILEYNWEVTKNMFLASMICPPAWCGIPCFLCYAHLNLKDDTYCQHVCVTQDGIKYVRDKHKEGCRFDCQDTGKVTKTVPFDKLTDCDVEEPAGADGPICCLVNRVLYTINVDTASGDRGTGGHELQLVGLKDPHGMKDLVWRMKRGSGGSPSAATSGPPQQHTMGGGNTGNMERLLMDQNKLLEESNGLLRQIVARKG